jgi:hypothetical protein
MVVRDKFASHMALIKNTSLLCKNRIMAQSLSYGNMITNGTLSYVNKVTSKSLQYKNHITTQSIFFKDVVAARSFLYKDLLMNIISDTIRSVPLEFKNGEIVINNREDFPVDGADAAEVFAVDGAGAAEVFADAVGGDLGVDAAGFGGADNRKVYVLLTKHRNATAMLLRLVTLKDYTHTSIALERDGSHYSFNPKLGFTVERPISRKRGTTPCKLYCIEVSDEAYLELESRIKWFVDNPDEYKFNYVGLVFSIFKIPLGIGNRYFCSQFVSDLLTASGAARLKGKPSKFMPRHFFREPDFTLAFDGEASTFEPDTEGRGSADI